MARVESVAKAGYYPTPETVIPLIAKHLGIDYDRDKERPNDYLNWLTMVDPCAGEGIAVGTLRDSIMKAWPPDHCETTIRGRTIAEEIPWFQWRFYLAELEESKFKALRWNFGTSDIHHGDAFLIDVRSHSRYNIESGANVLYLNPPYDYDPFFKRLEERFLQKFAVALGSGNDGVLVFVVPYYALSASAETLGKHFGEVECYRFPDGEFEVFKQVVLFAKKSTYERIPREHVVEQVRAWSETPPEAVIGNPEQVYLLKPETRNGSCLTWKFKDVDVDSLIACYQPWHRQSRKGKPRPVTTVMPDVPLSQILNQKYQVATPPRPAHIAVGVASGMFNGRKVEADSKEHPTLLVKGTFDKELKIVEEKKNKDGEVTSTVRVQHPVLKLSALDLDNRKFLSTEDNTITLEDLITRYGKSLANTMEGQCSINYDTRTGDNEVSLAPVSRKLYQAQTHAAKALVKLFGGNDCKSRKGKAAILLGEIGVGKTTVALTTAKTVASRVLVMMPPHLLAEWQQEAAMVVPEATVRVLQDISDVDQLRECKAPLVIGLLSRETAKLGHSWESVQGRCPRCGGKVPDGDLAKRRKRCSRTTWVQDNDYAWFLERFCQAVLPYFPEMVKSHLRGRSWVKKYLKYKSNPKEFAGCYEAIQPLMREIASDSSGRYGWEGLYLSLFFCESREEIVREHLSQHARSDVDNSHRHGLRSLIEFLPKDSQNDTGMRHRLGFKHSCPYVAGFGYLRNGGTMTSDKGPPNSKEAIEALYRFLVSNAEFKESEPCGEFLFQAVPKPRKVALSNYIAKRFTKYFDFLILDEGHEYSTEGSAQERAAHRLTALGVPTLLMTGSLMNGYARSLFTNLWALSKSFREEFSREQSSQFVDRYGYKKIVVDEETGKEKEFGAVTDRVQAGRVIGHAAGVLPLLLFRHILPMAVTLQKSDLSFELPANHQHVVFVEPEQEQYKVYQRLLSALKAQIRKDMFKPGLAGKLMGALSEFPSYLDRCTSDTGNHEDGSYLVRYPFSITNFEIASEPGFDHKQVFPKEQWMLDKIREELDEGRNVLVFAWHQTVLPRLARLIEEAFGFQVPVLQATKVQAQKRRAWIQNQVVAKKRRVLITNPVCVQTGLNNLVHFSTEIWMQNPMCNPIIFRQAIGRIDRIGQKKETRVWFPVYNGTLQTKLQDLLARKVLVSSSVDGIDLDSAILASGGGDETDYLMGLDLGRQIWAMMQEEE